MKVAGLIVPAQVITDPRVRLWLTCGVRPLVDDFCRSSVVSRLLSSYGVTTVGNEYLQI